jgi:hypothetical protein
VREEAQQPRKVRPPRRLIVRHGRRAALVKVRRGALPPRRPVLVVPREQKGHVGLPVREQRLERRVHPRRAALPVVEVRKPVHAVVAREAPVVRARDGAAQVGQPVQRVAHGMARRCAAQRAKVLVAAHPLGGAAALELMEKRVV